jgi:hypothetical protein
MSVISDETASEQIDAFLDYYDIDPETLPEKVGDAIVSSLAKIKRAIMAGQLEIVVDTETITITQNLTKPPKGFPGPVVYREITGQAKIGIKDDSGDYGKMYAFLGALCGEGIGVIQKLKGKDLSLAEALGCCFLQV